MYSSSQITAINIPTLSFYRPDVLPAELHNQQHQSTLFSSLSVLTAIFQWTWNSRFQNVSFLDFIGAKGDRGGGDNCSYKTCKTPVKTSPPTNQLPVFLQVRCPSCRPTSSVKALEAINYVYKTNVTKMFPQTDVSKCSLLVLLYCKEQGLSHIDACSRLVAQCLHVRDHRSLSISVAQLLSLSLYCTLASGAVYCNRSCLCVCLWHAGGRCLQRADGVCGGRCLLQR